MFIGIMINYNLCVNGLFLYVGDRINKLDVYIFGVMDCFRIWKLSFFWFKMVKCI